MKQETLEKVKDCYNSNKNFSGLELAEALKMHPRTVYCACKALGIVYDISIKQEILDEVKKLHDSGLKSRKISEILDIGNSKIIECYEILKIDSDKKKKNY